MSDISIDIPWWALAIMFATYAFVPVAIVTALVAVWYLRGGRTRAAGVSLAILAVPLFAGVYGGVTYVIPDWIADRKSEAAYAARTHTLATATRFHGQLLPAGTIVHDPYDASATSTSIELHEPATIAHVLVTGAVSYTQRGLDGDVTLARDATIGGIPCKATQAKFKDGAVTACTLSRVATIYGVPCSGDLLLGEAPSPDLACTIAKPYRRRGITFAPGSSALFGEIDIGTTPPSLRILGHGLAAKTRVTLDDPAIVVYFSGTPKIVYRGCGLETVVLANGRASASGYRESGECKVDLPRGAVTL